MISTSLLVAILVAGLTSAREAEIQIRKRQAGSGTPCASLTQPTVPGASVVSFAAAEARNVSSEPLFGGPLPLVDICDVNVTLTHGTAGDRVRVGIWMPLDKSKWNGRFQGTGGGGFVAGIFGSAMAPAIAQGYAAGSTDAGLNTTATSTDLNLSAQDLTNFASLSVHEMAVVGKAVSAQYFGSPVNFSYWNGCSTGGRQGLMEVQSFPEDFDGVLSIAPAINWERFVPAGLWPYAVLNEAKTFPPACVWDSFTTAAVEACDGEDGARDGLISDPRACEFDPESLVGKPAARCVGNETTTITASHAASFALMMAPSLAPNGTELWAPLEPGATLSQLATNPPNFLASTWIDDVLFPDQAFDFGSLTTQTFTDLFDRSIERFGSNIGTNNPDLSRFRDNDGKLLVWHGLTDQLIMPQGTFKYLSRVEEQLGGPSAVAEFFRVFAAPGVEHCAGGLGPEPLDALNVLIKWVEEGVAPERLPASKSVNGTTVSRNLCRWPMVLSYEGGDMNSAESWTCVQQGSAAGGGSSQGSASKVAWRGLLQMVVSVVVGLLLA
jgi:feruloyl esterase